MAEIREAEYLDPVDGLIHCCKCGGPRQAFIPDQFKGGSFKPRWPGVKFCVSENRQSQEMVR